MESAENADFIHIKIIPVEIIWHISSSLMRHQGTQKLVRGDK
jgi:hypothetical protein